MMDFRVLCLFVLLNVANGGNGVRGGRHGPQARPVRQLMMGKDEQMNAKGGMNGNKDEDSSMEEVAIDIVHQGDDPQNSREGAMEEVDSFEEEFLLEDLGEPLGEDVQELEEEAEAQQEMQEMQTEEQKEETMDEELVMEQADSMEDIEVLAPAPAPAQMATGVQKASRSEKGASYKATTAKTQGKDSKTQKRKKPRSSSNDYRMMSMMPRSKEAQIVHSGDAEALLVFNSGDETMDAPPFNSGDELLLPMDPILPTFPEIPLTSAPAVVEPATETPTFPPKVETDPPLDETDPPQEVETDPPETDPPETELPVLETDPPQTNPPLPPVDSVPPLDETGPIMGTGPPETEPPLMETDPPETEPTLTDTTDTTDPPLVVDWSSLPWEDLSRKLSSSTVLLQNNSPVDSYTKECTPEFTKEIPDRTHHNLVDQPSGLCMNQMFCAFERCSPLDASEYPNLTIEENIDILKYQVVDSNDMIQNQTLMDSFVDASNLAWNLPNTVLFPQNAGDVVAAINFAKEHGLEVSVKNSGHSYTGASTKRDTLHLNMNQYKVYTPTGIIDCPSTEATVSAVGFQSDLSDQPCKLATARGKPAVIHVGGGENFGESYLSVKAANEAQPNGYKYHMVGGAAGTVSPMGWTWQGGLASMSGGRMHGFGVDQVIRIDMVLPSGRHVRFGPTDWEDVNDEDDYIVPKTTVVTGVCHDNPEEEDEASWIWSTCPDDINFDDLWFAMRGGGGGTWGVVTSIILQLHDYGRLEVIDATAQFACIPDIVTYVPVLFPIWNAFLMAVLVNPISLGLTQDESNACAGFGSTFFCYGEGSSTAILSAWARHVEEITPKLVEEGKDTSVIDALGTSCSSEGAIYDDYASYFAFADGPHQGKAKDNPPPTYPSTNADSINIIIPAKYMIENPDKVSEFGLYYCAFAGNAKYASDQADGLSVAHREGANMVALNFKVTDEDFYTNVFPQMFDTTDPTNFPGFVGSNHAGPDTRGPLKDDWTKPCPLDWTREERDEKCISLQEAIWGTKTLMRLEEIKKTIDPNFMFDCYGCIGNNLPRSSDIGDVTGGALDDDLETPAPNGELAPSTPAPSERGGLIVLPPPEDPTAGTGPPIEEEEDGGGGDTATSVPTGAASGVDFEFYFDVFTTVPTESGP